MLDRVDPSELPNYTPIARPSASDVASFDDIYKVAMSIFSECVGNTRKTKVGWSSIGTSLGLWTAEQSLLSRDTDRRYSANL